jgi:hypothetical protein
MSINSTLRLQTPRVFAKKGTCVSSQSYRLERKRRHVVILNPRKHGTRKRLGFENLHNAETYANTKARTQSLSLFYVILGGGLRVVRWAKVGKGGWLAAGRALNPFFGCLSLLASRILEVM